MDGPVGYQRSFVCVRRHFSQVANEPQLSVSGTGTPPYAGYNQAAVGYWAGAQFTSVPNNTRPPGLGFRPATGEGVDQHRNL